MAGLDRWAPAAGPLALNLVYMVSPGGCTNGVAGIRIELTCRTPSGVQRAGDLVGVSGKPHLVGGRSDVNKNSSCS